MLQVVGAGFGRTGTLSLKVALDRLGFGPCHHMIVLFDKPDEIPLWRHAAHGEQVDWDEVLRGYRSTVDWPGARFWRQLVDRYSDAKVVLSVRDPERWYESVHSTIYHAATDDSLGSTAAFAELREMAREVVWDGEFQGRFSDREHALRIFNDHIEAVRRHVQPERLLVFEAVQGWEPLCDFLGVPVPDEPFPHRNGREEFSTMLSRYLAPSAIPAP